MAKVNLPSVLTKDSWFYKDSLEHLLGKPYISYSTVSSFLDYTEDFIKSKLIGVKDKGSIYADFGSFFGEMLETGLTPKENPNDFEGAELFEVDKYRTDGSEYERMIVIERDGYFIVGFIDQLIPKENGSYVVRDQKTGGKDKEKSYTKEEYIQTVLYAHALELEGMKVEGTEILFLRREGSHVRPPLKFSGEVLTVPLEYNEQRVEYALKMVDNAVKEITVLKNTFDKIFK